VTRGVARSRKKRKKRRMRRRRGGRRRCRRRRRRRRRRRKRRRRRRRRMRMRRRMILPWAWTADRLLQFVLMTHWPMCADGWMVLRSRRFVINAGRLTPS